MRSFFLRVARTYVERLIVGDEMLLSVDYGYDKKLKVTDNLHPRTSVRLLVSVFICFGGDSGLDCSM